MNAVWPFVVGAYGIVLLGFLAYGVRTWILWKRLCAS